MRAKHHVLARAEVLDVRVLEATEFANRLESKETSSGVQIDRLEEARQLSADGV